MMGQGIWLVLPKGLLVSFSHNIPRLFILCVQPLHCTFLLTHFCNHHITALSNFFNYSPGRQECLESAVENYPNLRKTKMIPLCRTRWVERSDALEVTLDLLEAIVDTFVEMSVNHTGRWNRDTVAQATSLLKGTDLEFIVTLGITQKILAFTSSITTGLQKELIWLKPMKTFS